jgi:peptide/nickel transport system substrate-binding protein/oligopeptide transport system substrate-binding protein
MTYPVTYAVDPSVVGPVLSNETWTDKLYQGATGQGGSGMFYVARWDHSGSIVLKRNPHWWGLSQGKKPTLSEIDFTIYAHNDAAYAAYQTGRFDAGFPTADLVPQAQHQPGYHQVPTLTTYALVMNWNIAPFNNLDARLALCLAIDRDALNQQLYGGRYLSTWHLVPQGMPGYNPALTGPDGVTSTQGDAHDARAHWQAYLRSLHGATPPPVVFSYIGESISQQQRAQTVQQQWQAVLGVHVAANAVYPGDVVDDSSARQLTSFNWQADYPDPQDFLSLLLAPDSQYGTGVNLPPANALDQQADTSSDPARRDALYQQAEQLFVNQVARCPLFQDVMGYQVRPWVHGWEVDALGLTPLDAWVATFIAAH